ncbi:HAD-IA family hydrolase [Shewanella sp. AS16]|uniref:HAD-IA family hydrolase n=1 Tax=Shewanella sp. AS16 TaxID=2907625 RepID=UPI001F3D7C2F|nr:HAD-IA family hydrolase [Shewanella sp. AS16]MCE9685965.1 HAD-IA family hydrolase [Shewanella sp. AS16]
MKSYLRLGEFKALSFDLDDTLYDNAPYIRRAEAEQLAFLHRQFPATRVWQLSDWHSLKHRLLAQDPGLAQDTTKARRALLTQGLLSLGYSETQARRGAAEGLACFLAHRSDFCVPAGVIRFLQRLGQRYPLIGITNGNVDPQRIGLGQVLQFVLQPGEGLRMKPHGDMFSLACERLAIAPRELLHIGDSYAADVQGARRGGCQVAWLNPAYARNEPKPPTAGQLPQLEIASLDCLLSLLD